MKRALVTAVLLCFASLFIGASAQLWINHDKAQRDTLKMSPVSYD